jgi:hypothetical protein
MATEEVIGFKDSGSLASAFARLSESDKSEYIQAIIEIKNNLGSDKTIEQAVSEVLEDDPPMVRTFLTISKDFIGEETLRQKTEASIRDALGALPSRASKATPQAPAPISPAVTPEKKPEYIDVIDFLTKSKDRAAQVAGLKDLYGVKEPLEYVGQANALGGRDLEFYESLKFEDGLLGEASKILEDMKKHIKIISESSNKFLKKETESALTWCKNALSELHFNGKIESDKPGDQPLTADKARTKGKSLTFNPLKGQTSQAVPETIVVEEKVGDNKLYGYLEDLISEVLSGEDISSLPDDIREIASNSISSKIESERLSFVVKKMKFAAKIIAMSTTPEKPGWFLEIIDRLRDKQINTEEINSEYEEAKGEAAGLAPEELFILNTNRNAPLVEKIKKTIPQPSGQETAGSRPSGRGRATRKKPAGDFSKLSAFIEKFKAQHSDDTRTIVKTLIENITVALSEDNKEKMLEAIFFILGCANKQVPVWLDSLAGDFKDVYSLLKDKIYNKAFSRIKDSGGEKSQYFIELKFNPEDFNTQGPREEYREIQRSKRVTNQEKFDEKLSSYGISSGLNFPNQCLEIVKNDGLSGEKYPYWIGQYSKDHTSSKPENTVPNEFNKELKNKFREAIRLNDSYLEYIKKVDEILQVSGRSPSSVEEDEKISMIIELLAGKRETESIPQWLKNFAEMGLYKVDMVQQFNLMRDKLNLPQIASKTTEEDDITSRIGLLDIKKELENNPRLNNAIQNFNNAYIRTEPIGIIQENISNMVFSFGQEISSINQELVAALQGRSSFKTLAYNIDLYSYQRRVNNLVFKIKTLDLEAYSILLELRKKSSDPSLDKLIIEFKNSCVSRKIFEDNSIAKNFQNVALLLASYNTWVLTQADDSGEDNDKLVRLSNLPGRTIVNKKNLEFFLGSFKNSAFSYLNAKNESFFNLDNPSGSNNYLDSVKLNDLILKRNSIRAIANKDETITKKKCPVCFAWVETANRMKKKEDYAGVEGIKVPLFSIFDKKTGNLVDLNLLNKEEGWPVLNESFYDRERERNKVRNYTGNKTWSEINTLLQSNNSELQEEGWHRRAGALFAVGAEKLSGPIFIRDRFVECPFDSEGTSGSFCGAKVEPNSSTYLSDNVGVSFGWSGVEHPTDAKKRINNFTEASKNVIIPGSEAWSNERSAAQIELAKSFLRGGFKFSKTNFACTAHIENVTNLTEYKHPKMAFSKLGPAGTESFIKPTNPDGTLKDLEPGTITFRVCGAPTSLSSFVKDDNSEFFILKTLEVISQDEGQYTELFNELVSNGLDFQDAMTLHQDFVNFKAAKDSELELAKTSFNKIRIQKIKEMLLKTAAGQIAQGSILQSLNLKCPFGHIFNVGHSLKFGEGNAAYETNDSNNILLTQKSGKQNSQEVLNQGWLALADTTALMEKFPMENRLLYSEWVSKDPRERTVFPNVKNNQVKYLLKFFIDDTNQPYIFIKYPPGSLASIWPSGFSYEHPSTHEEYTYFATEASAATLSIDGGEEQDEDGGGGRGDITMRKALESAESMGSMGSPDDYGGGDIFGAAPSGEGDREETGRLDVYAKAAQKLQESNVAVPGTKSTIKSTSPVTGPIYFEKLENFSKVMSAVIHVFEAYSRSALSTNLLDELIEGFSVNSSIPDEIKISLKQTLRRAFDGKVFKFKEGMPQKSKVDFYNQFFGNKIIEEIEKITGEIGIWIKQNIFDISSFTFDESMSKLILTTAIKKAIIAVNEVIQNIDSVTNDEGDPNRSWVTFLEQISIQEIESSNVLQEATSLLLTTLNLDKNKFTKFLQGTHDKAKALPAIKTARQNNAILSVVYVINIIKKLNEIISKYFGYDEESNYYCGISIPDDYVNDILTVLSGDKTSQEIETLVKESLENIKGELELAINELRNQHNELINEKKKDNSKLRKLTNKYRKYCTNLDMAYFELSKSISPPTETTNNIVDVINTEIFDTDNLLAAKEYILGRLRAMNSEAPQSALVSTALNTVNSIMPVTTLNFIPGEYSETVFGWDWIPFVDRENPSSILDYLKQEERFTVYGSEGKYQIFEDRRSAIDYHLNNELGVTSVGWSKLIEHYMKLDDSSEEKDVAAHKNNIFECLMAISQNPSHQKKLILALGLEEDEDNNLLDFAIKKLLADENIIFTEAFKEKVFELFEKGGEESFSELINYMNTSDNAEIKRYHDIILDDLSTKLKGLIDSIFKTKIDNFIGLYNQLDTNSEDLNYLKFINDNFTAEGLKYKFKKLNFYTNKESPDSPMTGLNTSRHQIGTRTPRASTQIAWPPTRSETTWNWVGFNIPLDVQKKETNLGDSKGVILTGRRIVVNFEDKPLDISILIRIGRSSGEQSLYSYSVADLEDLIIEHSEQLEEMLQRDKKAAETDLYKEIKSELDKTVSFIKNMPASIISGESFFKKEDPKIKYPHVRVTLEDPITCYKIIKNPIIRGAELDDDEKQRLLRFIVSVFGLDELAGIFSEIPSVKEKRSSTGLTVEDLFEKMVPRSEAEGGVPEGKFYIQNTVNSIFAERTPPELSSVSDRLKKWFRSPGKYFDIIQNDDNDAGTVIRYVNPAGSGGRIANINDFANAGRSTSPTKPGSLLKTVGTFYTTMGKNLRAYIDYIIATLDDEDNENEANDFLGYSEDFNKVNLRKKELLCMIISLGLPGLEDVRINPNFL